MYENARATTRHRKLRVDVGGESAFRDSEDDGIGAFYWSDEGFGYAIGANADRALLLPLAETLPADRRMAPEPSFRRHQGRPAALITAGWPLTKILQDPQRAMIRRASRCPPRGSRIEQRLYAFHEIFFRIKDRTAESY
jgi:hypothetical protein